MSGRPIPETTDKFKYWLVHYENEQQKGVNHMKEEEWDESEDYLDDDYDDVIIDDDEEEM